MEVLFGNSDFSGWLKFALHCQVSLQLMNQVADSPLQSKHLKLNLKFAQVCLWDIGLSSQIAMGHLNK